MALNGATPGGDGDWYTRDEWNAMGAESARVLFRVREHQAPEQMTNGQVHPVVADILVLSGSRKDEFHPGERMIGRGLTSPLRKVKIGDDMLAVMATGKHGATVDPQANPPTAEDMARVGKLYEGGKDPIQEAADKHAAANGTAPALVGAGGGSDDEPPW